MEFTKTYISIVDERGNEVNLKEEQIKKINKFLEMFNYHLAICLKK